MRDHSDERSGIGGVDVLARPVPLGTSAHPEVLRLRADPDLAALLPHPFLDLRGAPDVLGVVDDGRPAGSSLLDASITGKVGAALGVWHSASRRHRQRFGVATPVGPFLDRDHGAVAADPLLRVVLDALRREWWPTAVVHGDVGSRTVVLAPADHGGVRVVLADWDRVGLGDPAWDLGCLLAEILATAVQAGDGRDAGPAMAAALAAYGLTAAMPWDPAGFARRTALSAVARLAAGVQADGEGEAGGAGSLDLARSVAAWLPTWTRRFERWLGEPHERAGSRVLVERSRLLLTPGSAAARSRAAHPAGRRA